ncbi:putative BOI-related E3 ubiquitin-protein ligase 2 [Cardamine amara subsp. amara]|uniref:RING-type E3 ubiquitin transferase n=1 Tax=Cardamine amara subsp. amara TaxID=228776 RepID=A0ABD1B116_CARAN
MAVDAHHLLLSPPQLFSNRGLMMNNNNNSTMEPTNNQTGYGVVSPFSDTPPLLHMYGNVSSTADTIPTTADYYTDGSDFFPLPSRKRSRDSSRSNYYHHHHPLLQNPRSSCVNANAATTTTTTPFSFLGQDIDISSHINQQQHEIDRFISLHMERVKYEIEERRKRQAMTIMEAIEQGLVKRLRVKEEERDRIGKINHALEERVKSLSIENQIWRDLAQTNEATANNLRTNLEQVLAQVKDPGAGLDNVNPDEDDAQSCCGSSSGEETVRRTVAAVEAHDKAGRMCRSCGEEESCVLLLPCRHLCLCGVCGSSVHTCPICRSPKNASVHVNMSS